MLDTNVLSDLMRSPSGPITHSIARVGVANICTSIVVASELRYGAEKSGSVALISRVSAILGRMSVEPFAAPADEVYGRIRAELAAAGRVIGGNDLLIAAHALALDCVLVTDNQREFERVKDLTIENWRR